MFSGDGLSSLRDKTKHARTREGQARRGKDAQRLAFVILECPRTIRLELFKVEVRVFHSDFLSLVVDESESKSCHGSRHIS